jgi:hypothetical protein
MNAAAPAPGVPQDPLIEAVTADFVAHFVPGGEVLHRGDMDRSVPERDGGGNPWIPDVDQDRLPDVTILDSAHDKRREELARLFPDSAAWLEFVSALSTHAQLGPHSDGIAWETVVWVADAPTHLIHFNGSRVLGPYR